MARLDACRITHLLLTMTSLRPASAAVALGVVLALVALATCAAPVLAQTPQPDPPATSVAVLATDYGVTADAARDQSAQLESAWLATLRASTPEAPARLVLPAGVIGYSRIAFGLPPESVVGCPAIETADTVPAVRVEPVDGSPVPRVVPTGRGTTLRVVDTWAAEFAAGRTQASRVSFPSLSASLTELPGRQFGTRSYRLAEGPSCVTLRGIEVDGNEGAAVAAFRSMPGPWLETNFRNGVGHGGFVTGTETGTFGCTDDPLMQYRHPTSGFEVWREPSEPGVRVFLRDVYVHGFLAVNVLGGACPRFSVKNIRVGRSLYNHAIYNADGGRRGFAGFDRGPLSDFGGYETITLESGSWTEWITAWGIEVVGLRVEPSEGPNVFSRDPAEVFNARGGRAAVYGVALGQPLGWTGTDGSRMPRNWSNGQTDRLDLPEWYTATTTAAPEPAPQLPPEPETPRPPVVTPEPPPVVVVPPPVVTPPPASRYVREVTHRCRDSRSGRLVALALCPAP